MHWTVNRLTHFQASALRLKEAETQSLHRTIRNIVTKDVVDSVADESDSRGTRIMTNEQAATVLLLVPLAKMAMDVRGLRSIANRLKQPRFNETVTEIQHALVEIKAGKTVTLVHQLFVEGEEGKGTAFLQRTRFEIAGEPEEPNLLAEAYGTTEPSYVAKVEVPASDLLRAFVS